MPECHYGSIQDSIADHLWYKENTRKKLHVRTYVSRHTDWWQTEYLIIWHLSSTVGARLKKFYCISTYICWPLAIIMWIRNFTYFDIRTCFHLICNYIQTNPTSTDIPPTPIRPSTAKKTIVAKHCHSQHCSCFKWPEILTSQEQLTFLDIV